ncbi:enoyl-CoA hydratase/isomerase family protein [Sphingomonas montanisoli]|uniref:Enoyl-CoA hydratase/isomerase family protein n=1 Tax=Sphingomonas montanisoli TaxID=2606412 RepID=A0A5D9C4M7_9SPHN|nr:enoyl-CoA hydratase/isomerase family protein [Sphingomonas montanisoli]TZG24981.1 enoyl-CoA hydratase/isomerase family protein [Sphingomonas montanisoli]
MAEGAPPLLVERTEDDIVIVTLNRRQAVNSVSFEMWELFGAALDEIERNTPPRGLVVTGAGGFFCIGGDVKLPPARGEGALSPATRLEMGQRIIARLRKLPVPVISAVEGGAFGIGLALALSADMVFAGEGSQFGAPFIDYGTVPDGGATWLLERQIGRYRTAELIFSGRTIDVAEASSLGLISRATPKGEALSTAVEFLKNVGQGNAHATELAKRLLQGAQEGGIDASHSLELAYCAICQTGEEVARAREAFIAKAQAARAAKAEAKG